MQTVQHGDVQEFLSEVYRDRPIAILHRFGRWHVYLDHVLQHNVLFGSADDAVAWLVSRVDQGIQHASTEPFPFPS
jgi:hypothetical protein